MISNADFERLEIRVRALELDLLGKVIDLKDLRNQVAGLKAMRPSAKMVHNAVRNYVVNELKVTKEMVLGQIDHLCRQAVSDLLGLHYENEQSPGRRWVTEIVKQTIGKLLDKHVQEQVRRMTWDLKVMIGNGNNA